MANSRPVLSNQMGVHEDLARIVQNHVESEYLKPVSTYSSSAFKEVEEKVHRAGGAPIILDSGCGTVDSTIFLAHKHPDCLIIGIDKSAVRLQKIKNKVVPENVLLARVDQFDFWRLLAACHWNIRQHFILYPNPWPKKAHLKRRIYGHPLFIELPKITKNIEVRSNWSIYLQEFALAWSLLTAEKYDVVKFDPDPPMSSFEKKYKESGQQLFRLNVQEC